MRAVMRRSCSSCPTSSHSLMSWMPLPTTIFSTAGQSSQEPFVLLLGAEPHHVLDAGAVVPAAIEDDDLARGREVRDVALHVHLRLFAIRRRGQRDHAEHARAHPLGQRPDRPALARRVAPFEDDDHAVARVFHPLLHHAQLGLQLPQLLRVRAVLHCRTNLGAAGPRACRPESPFGARGGFEAPAQRRPPAPYQGRQSAARQVPGQAVAESRPRPGQRREAHEAQHQHDGQQPSRPRRHAGQQRRGDRHRREPEQRRPRPPPPPRSPGDRAGCSSWPARTANRTRPIAAAAPRRRRTAPPARPTGWPRRPTR